MAHLPPAIARVRGALRDFLTRRFEAGDLGAGDLVLVACSGGADSVALAAGAAFLAPRMGIRAGLVTVDHGMQAGSADQARAVRELGERLGLAPAVVHTAAESDGQGQGQRFGPEGTARELRYAALEEAAAVAGARAVLLGHTMEDQAETVLLGLSRGAGTRAVAGMPAMRGIFWRPLLPVRRSETEGACAAADLPVWQDPTNAPDGPWRTAGGEALPRAALRHSVLPALAAALGQDPVPALARTAELTRADSDLLEQLAATHAASIARPEPGREVPPGAAASIDVDKLTALPPALRWRVIRELIAACGAPEGQTGMVHVRAVDALVTDWRGQRGADVPGGGRVVRSCGRLYGVTPSTLERT